jgi:hypothetical protein
LALSLPLPSWQKAMQVLPTDCFEQVQAFSTAGFISYEQRESPQAGPDDGKGR